MRFLYPRTVSIYRQKTTTSVGDRGYSSQRGPLDTNAVEGLGGLKCSIQLDRQGQHNPADLPSDATHSTIWRVFIPRSAGAQVGSIQSTDVVIDDTNVAYQIFAAYWDSLGWQLRATLLEP